MKLTVVLALSAAKSGGNKPTFQTCLLPPSSRVHRPGDKVIVTQIW